MMWTPALATRAAYWIVRDQHRIRIDTHLAFLWQPRNWVGVGLGCDRLNLDLKVEGDDFRGELA